MSQTMMVGERNIEEDVDMISKLPDAILQHILCFNNSTKLAIRTSILSRRWRHIWCELPSLSLDVDTLQKATSINETLTKYTAPKTTSFHLTTEYAMKDTPYIDTWIKFAMSHNVENLSLDFSRQDYEYKLPDFFYSTSSFKQLNITLSSKGKIIPECTVSWTSLQKLSLTCNGLSEESMAKILSGCPVLENLSLNFLPYYDFKFPDCFYSTSSFKQLNINIGFCHMIVPEYCTVSWTSLRSLFLRCCSLSDESMAKILSGCPILEKLKLYHCDKLEVLDLSNSLRLRALEVTIGNMTVSGPRQIVAPHVHYLRLYDPKLACTLVDVASLTEAELEVSRVSLNSDFNANFIQAMVLKMLDKLKNAEKLKLGRSFIQILSLAEIRGVPFPMLKVKALTLDTEIFQYVIPVIERLLQNSPDLETLTLRARSSNTTSVEILDKCLKLQGFNVNKCWRSKNGASWTGYCRDPKLEHVASLVEVVVLDERYLKFKIEDLIATLSHHNNVTIVLSSTNKPSRSMTSEERCIIMGGIKVFQCH